MLAARTLNKSASAVRKTSVIPCGVIDMTGKASVVTSSASSVRKPQSSAVRAHYTRAKRKDADVTNHMQIKVTDHGRSESGRNPGESNLETSDVNLEGEGRILQNF